MQIKVCGITNLEQATALQAMGVHYIGFIFYPASKRYVLEKLSLIDLANFNPVGVKKVGVFVDESFEIIVSKIEKHSLNCIQLHGSESAEYCKKLKEIPIEIIKVFSIKDNFDFEILKEFEKEKSNEQPSYMQSKDLPKNPKHVKTVREELENEFDMIERIIEQIADQHAVDADLVWEDLSTLTDDELYVFAVTSEMVNEDWQKANKRDKTDGMSQKAVNSYRRENPGSKLKTAVTTKPGKLKKGSKASKRRSSYCSRSAGQQKMHNISCSKTPDKAICKARRRWNC